MSSACRRPASVPLSLLGLAGFVSAADNWIVAPILPSVAAGLGVSVPAASAVLCAYLLPYGLLQPLHGHLAERHGRLLWLRRLMYGLACGTACCAVAPTLSWLCLARFVTGGCAAGMIAVSLALIGASLPPGTRQCQVGRFMGLVFLGQALGAGFGGWVAGRVGWRALFALFALLALPVARRLRGEGGRVSQAAPAAGFWPPLLAAIRDRKGQAIYALALATGCLLLGMYGFLGASLQQRSGLCQTATGFVLAGFGLASLAAGQRVGAGMAGRFERLDRRPRRCVAAGHRLRAGAVGAGHRGVRGRQWRHFLRSGRIGVVRRRRAGRRRGRDDRRRRRLPDVVAGCRGRLPAADAGDSRMSTGFCPVSWPIGCLPYATKNLTAYSVWL